jgi:hypothetical protein
MGRHVEFHYPYLQSGTTGAQRKGRSYVRWERAVTEISETDPLEAPVVARLAPPESAMSFPPLELRDVDGVLMRPVLSPRTGLPCGFDEFVDLVAAQRDHGWIDDPKPVVETAGQEPLSLPPHGEVKVRWADLCYSRENLAQCLGAMARLTVIDGVVHRPSGEPWLTIGASARYWSLDWRLDGVNTTGHPRERGRRVDRSSADLVASVAESPWRVMTSFPLHHVDAAYRFASDPTSRYGLLDPPLQPPVEVLDPRPFERLHDEEWRLAATLVSFFRVENCASTTGELADFCDRFVCFLARLQDTADDEALGSVLYNGFANVVARWTTREKPPAPEDDCGADAEALKALAP